MAKYKVTVLEQGTGLMVAEIVESYQIGPIGQDIYYMVCGRNGILAKIELVIEADNANIIDHTLLPMSN